MNDMVSIRKMRWCAEAVKGAEAGAGAGDFSFGNK
jgi:hypothetical protein